eukprot:8013120-Alexandrium_andersonii.AAC.1
MRVFFGFLVASALAEPAVVHAVEPLDSPCDDAHRRRRARPLAQQLLQQSLILLHHACSDHGCAP